MEQKVLNIISELCDDTIVFKERDINLFDTGLLDSMSFIELLTRFEEDFNISIDPSEINKDKMGTPNLLIYFVKDKRKK